MYTQIKKKWWFKLLLIFLPIIIISVILLGVVAILVIALSDGFGQANKSINIVLTNPYSIISDVSNINITIDTYDENSKLISVIYNADVTINEDTQLKINENGYKITSVYFNNMPIINKDNYYYILSNGQGSLRIHTTYSLTLDTYKKYSGFFVTNTIEDSSLNLSNNFKIKKEKNLLLKNTRINIVTSNSSLKYYRPSERITFYRIYRVYFVFSVIYVISVTTFSIIVFVKSRKEKKLNENKS